MNLTKKNIRRYHKPTVNKKVVLCTNCKGEGKVQHHTEDPNYSGEWIVNCPICNGSGRLLRIRNTTFEQYPQN